MDYGTIFECDGFKAIRHRVGGQETKTACGKKLVYDTGRNPPPTFHADHDLPKEERCKKCYPRKGGKK